MSLAIIEINDSGHCCGNEMGEIFISPGYAFLTNDGIETGDIISNFKVENLNRPDKSIIYPVALLLLVYFGYFNYKRK